MKIKIKKHDNESSFKALVAFFIILVAVGIYALFEVNKADILESGKFQSFVILTIMGMGLLIGLLFLVNKPLKKARRR